MKTMRKVAILFVLTVLAIFLNSAVFAQETSSDIKDRLGIYHWDGTYLSKSTDPLVEGAQRVKEGGSRVINIVALPEWDYRLGEKFEPSSLTLRARRADYANVLSDPDFSTIVITAFDWASYPKRYLNLPVATNERAEILNKISAEFSDFVFYLAQISRGQNKTVIIKDWEVEHRMGVSYARTTSVAKMLDPIFAGGFRTLGLSQTAIAQKWQDYLDYIVARQRGVDLGKKRAVNSGVTSVKFFNAVETFNVYPLFDAAPMEDSVLWQMSQRKTKVDLVSFSGWEPIWGSDPFNIYFGMRTSLKRITDFIQANGIAQKIFLGEAGILDSYNPELLRYIYDAVEENPDVVLMVKWNLYNVESAGWLGVFGNYDVSGRITPQGVFMNELLSGRLPKIGGIVDGLTHENQTQPGGTIEIYGQNFPEEISCVKILLALGNSRYMEAEVLHASSTQINAKIPDLPELSGRTVFVKVNNSNFQPIFIGTPSS